MDIQDDLDRIPEIPRPGMGYGIYQDGMEYRQLYIQAYDPINMIYWGFVRERDMIGNWVNEGRPVAYSITWDEDAKCYDFCEQNFTFSDKCP